MKKNYPRLTLAAFMLSLLLITIPQAHAASVRELGNQLQERDKVILELLERVEALEQQLGVKSVKQATDIPAAEKKPATDSAQAPGLVVVEEGAAERALERSLAREGALLLPPGLVELEARGSYTRQEETAPAFVPVDNQIFAAETERNVNNLTAGLELRMGLPWDSQFEIGIPYRWREVESVRRVDFAPVEAAKESGSGLGDLRLGLAKTLLEERRGFPDLIGRITWDTDTGKSRDNGISLAGGFHELHGSLTAIKRQDPVVFVGGLSYEHAFEKDQIQPGPVLAANMGGHIALSPKTSLSLFITAAHQQETKFSGEKVDGSDRMLGTFQLGGSTLLTRGTLLSLSGGMGLTDDADDFSISVSVTKRFRSPLLFRND